MPLYLFENPKTKEVEEVFFNMNDDKIYKGPKGKDKPWVRLYTVPQAFVNPSFDPHDVRDFVHKTKDKGAPLGDLLDRSEELSRKRAKESDNGRDKVKDAYFDKWSKKRPGKTHELDDRVKKVK